MEQIERMTAKERLEHFAGWVSRNDAAWSGEDGKMDKREALYRGTQRSIRALTVLDTERDGSARKAVHVRNIVAENIESQVSSAIPQPKVTAKRKEDEWRAKIIEDMLRNELDRLPFETMNDQMERTVPIQGGAFWLVDWDNSRRTHDAVGDVTVGILHPKQVVPQDGVYGSVEDMDAIVLRLPQTKGYILRRYGVDVADESEQEPEVKGAGDVGTAEDLVTQYIAYYRNEEGGIGRFSWVGERVLEDLTDYQARILRRCSACGTVMGTGETHCPVCGGVKSRSEAEEYEVLSGPVMTRRGEIPASRMEISPEGAPIWEPVKIPYYKPNVFPVILQKNISVYGQLMGESDVDKIADQQNTVNRLETKVIDRLIKAGSRVTLPDRADFRIDPEDSEKWYIGNAADKNLIDVYQFSGNLQYEMAYLAQVYEEARQALGITDSFQGRSDTTAKSGVAKQFAAAQSAGRLESRRVLKDAAYAEIFRRIFQFKLAYADEPRAVVSTDDRGNAKYEEFNRYDFLERDAAGQWYWVDDFLFSCDTSAPLANNRERMWETTTGHLQAGAFGNPGELDTLILYWTKMELLHYPGAADTKAALEQRKQAQMAAAAQAQQEAAAQAAAQQQAAVRQGGGLPPELEAAARQAAMRDAEAIMMRGGR